MKPTYRIVLVKTGQRPEGRYHSQVRRWFGWCCIYDYGEYNFEEESRRLSWHINDLKKEAEVKAFVKTTSVVKMYDKDGEVIT